MKLFDSHCHLDDPVYDDIDSIIQKAAQSDVHAMMIAGINLATSFKAVSLSNAYPEIFASVGFHPHDAASCNESALRELMNLAKNPRVRAWGEIGLDFNRMHSPRDDQEKWLIRQIEIADECLLPIIFHERETEGRLIEILKMHHRQPGNGVIHCFSGNRQELLAYLDMGYRIGITGILTLHDRGKALRGLARLIPVDRLLIETDAPYLTPAPEKNHHRRNEPAFVRSVLLKLAEIRDEDPEILANALWANTCRLYRITEFGLKTEG